jgi:hypothetical protein
VAGHRCWSKRIRVNQIVCLLSNDSIGEEKRAALLEEKRKLVSSIKSKEKNSHRDPSCSVFRCSYLCRSAMCHALKVSSSTGTAISLSAALSFFRTVDWRHFDQSFCITGRQLPVEHTCRRFDWYSCSVESIILYSGSTSSKIMREFDTHMQFSVAPR